MNITFGDAVLMDELIDALVNSGRGQKSPAWVLGSSVNSLSFVRSLGRRGIPCVVIDDEKLIAAESRYCRFLQVGLEYLSSPTGLSALKEAASRCTKSPVLFATSDGHNDYLATYSDELSEFFSFILPPTETMDVILDKKRQYEAAEASAVPIPRCMYPKNSQDFSAVSSEIGFPCIIKPCVAHVGRKLIGGRKVRVVDNKEELWREWENLGEACSQFMVQEIIPGGDDCLFGYLAFWDENCQEIAWVTKQKLRQNPPIYGDGSLQRSVECDPVRSLSKQFLKNLEYRGFVSVEFKKDERDGEFRLMEINPRTVSGNQLAISAGVDLPWIGYCYLTDSKCELSGKFKPGIQFVNEEWDLRAYIAMRKTGQLSLTEFLGSLFQSTSRALWAWDDPKPALRSLISVLKAFKTKYNRNANGRRVGSD